MKEEERYRSDLERCVLRMKELVCGEDHDEAVLRYYKALAGKLARLVNADKVRRYELSTLYTFSRNTASEAFSRILEESNVDVLEWEQYQSRRLGSEAQKASEPDLFSSMEV